MGIFTIDSGVGQAFVLLLLRKKKTNQPSYFALIAYKSMSEMDTFCFKGRKYYHRSSLVINFTFS